MFVENTPPLSAVAKRQKHNGMSWSESGLADVTTIFSNHEEQNWIIGRKLEFKLRSGIEDNAA